MATPKQRADMSLPPRPFFYTLDQIAALLSMDLGYFKARYVHFQGRHTGYPSEDKLQAIDIAPPGEDGVPTTQPDWRIHEDEYIRWLRRKGFRINQRTIQYHISRRS